jgi:hypothetical protein
MRDVNQSGAAALRVAISGLLRGRDLAGEALLALEEDALVLSTGRGRIIFPLATIEGVRAAPGTLEIYLRAGDAIRVSGPPGLFAFAEDLAGRVYALPDLTLSLRTFGSRRAIPGPDHDRFFAPLLAARRAASDAPTWREALDAFDAAVLRAGVAERLREFAAERYPDDPPERRALEAELFESAEALLARLAALERAQRALAASEDAERFLQWRAWSAALGGVFETADACWLALAAILVSERRGEPSRWRRLTRFMGRRRA